jgi:hypothetical protein
MLLHWIARVRQRIEASAKCGVIGEPAPELKSIGSYPLGYGGSVVPGALARLPNAEDRLSDGPSCASCFSPLNLHIVRRSAES